MSLAETLHKIHEGSKTRIPAEKRAIMERATNDLRDSGIMDGVVKVGDPLPAFQLANANGDTIASSDLLSRGAVVLTVFRGSW